MKLCMAVTNDKYELPMAVCENAKELAEKFRMDPKRVSVFVYCGSILKYDGVKVVRVEA